MAIVARHGQDTGSERVNAVRKAHAQCEELETRRSLERSAFQGGALERVAKEFELGIAVPRPLEASRGTAARVHIDTKMRLRYIFAA